MKSTNSTENLRMFTTRRSDVICWLLINTSVKWIGCDLQMLKLLNSANWAISVKIKKSQISQGLLLGNNLFVHEHQTIFSRQLRKLRLCYGVVPSLCYLRMSGARNHFRRTNCCPYCYTTLYRVINKPLLHVFIWIESWPSSLGLWINRRCLVVNQLSTSSGCF